MTDHPLSILLLCDFPPRIATTVRDHIEALESLSRHRWFRLSMLGDIPASVDLDRFDAIVVHYTLSASIERYLSIRSRARLGSCRALKAIFIQDEYRHVNASIAAMREIGVKLLFTCVPVSEISKVYSENALPGVDKVNVLTGYVPERLLNRTVLAPSKRAFLVGYRSRRLPFWLGRLGEEKYTIGTRFLADAERFPRLACDISLCEEDRLYGERWIEFLVRCRAVLGVESGASVFDFTGELQRAVELAVRRNPALGFGEIHRRYLADMDGKIQLNQISPRCYEAAALRTVMVMYPGEYSGRLLAWRHYIPLAKDHSNMDEVVEALSDTSLVDEMADRTYNEVALAPENSYAAFVKDVDEQLAGAFNSSMAAGGPAYRKEEIAWLRWGDLGSHQKGLRRAILIYGHFLVFRWLLCWVKPTVRERLDRRLRSYYRAIVR